MKSRINVFALALAVLVAACSTTEYIMSTKEVE